MSCNQAPLPIGDRLGGAGSVPRSGDLKAYIRRHLQDPGLTPSRIAAAHYVSRSQLHRLFQQEGTTVAGYIRRLRLEAARRDLGDPAQSGTPIHVIAARWGYPRAADFTRAFRSAYQLPPSAHRSRALRALGRCGRR
nr:AraC family transcriptional regulator [Phaeacidiphilus oryzae]